jgi:hypothetical protein
MNVFSVLLVVIGLIALALSLVPLTSICRHDTGYRIPFWLVGYAVKSVDEIFINTIKTYCDQMGISFVVPNIQDELILAKLREMGVNQFQGDILCPFIPETEMNGWLVRYFEKTLENK